MPPTVRAAPDRLPRRGRFRVPSQWPSWAVVLLLVALWKLATSARLLDPAIVSTPGDVAAAALAALGSSEIYLDTGITFLAVVIGLAAGVAAGVPLGIVMALSPAVRWSSEWLLLVTNSLPRFALAPLIIIVLGLGVTSKGTVAFLASVIPITLLLMNGVRDIPVDIHRVARSFRLSKGQVLTKIVLPASLPHLLTGTQLGFSRALASVIVAEMYNPHSGLGRWIAIGQVSLDASHLVFASVLVAGIGAAFVHGFNTVGRRLTPWHA